MKFDPFVLSVGDMRLLLMKAKDDNIMDLLMLEKAVYSGQTPWSSFSFESELRKSNNSLYLVAYDADNLVAFIGVRFHPREAHITNIAVAPNYQAKGIGSSLINLMIDKARQNNCECISLEVRVDNDKAKRLYRQLGFETTFIRKNYYQDTNTDAANMVLWLMPHPMKRKKFVL